MAFEERTVDYRLSVSLRIELSGSILEPASETGAEYFSKEIENKERKCEEYRKKKNNKCKLRNKVKRTFKERGKRRGTKNNCKTIAMSKRLRAKI